MQPSEVIDFNARMGVKISPTTLKNYVRWGLVTKPKTGFAPGQRGRFTDYDSVVPFEVYAANKMLAQKVSVETVRMARQFALRREIPSWFPKDPEVDEIKDRIIVWMPPEVMKTSPAAWLGYYLDAKYYRGVDVPPAIVGTVQIWNESILPEGIVVVEPLRRPDNTIITAREKRNGEWIVLEEVSLKTVP